MKLLLFDIDGTLIHANGAGRATLRRALSDWADRPVSTEGVPFSGRTDPYIVESILDRNDLPTTQAAVDEALDAYVEAMRGTLTKATVDVLPGVRSLLDTLDVRDDAHLGLVTGNVESVAYEKLAVHELDEFFSFGAFGSDHADRNELPVIARRRAQVTDGASIPTGQNVVVIGDTVHDIECAKASGARVLSVSTGRYARSDLAAHEPDVLLDTLDDTEQVVQHLLHG